MTREEAMKIVRENYPHFGTTEPWLDLEKALATLIPELAESEDERIRKEIVGVIQKHYPNTPESYRWIAYLEKQKDSVSNAKYIEDIAHAFEDGRKKGIEEKQNSAPISCSHENGTPAEWSEEDKSFYDSIMCEVIKEGMHPTPEQGKWLKSLPERFNLQPKQEWNTLDKAIVNCIVCCLDGQFVSEAARKQSLEWFNKHRRDFLNSTSWKPSEEQMEQNYIRKEAILERIKERLKLYDSDDPEAETACYELQSIISWLDGKEEENESSNTQNRENRRSIGC